jgi:hypothetical protein
MMTPLEVVERRDRNGVLIHVLRSRPSLKAEDRRFLNLLTDQRGLVSNSQSVRLNEMAGQYRVSFVELL